MKPAAAPTASIPLIHLEAPDRAALRDACESWGLFQLADHGMPEATVLDLRRAARNFFDSLPAQKAAVTRTSENPWGYFDRELTKNVRDWKEIFDVGPEYGTSKPQWPDGMPGFRQALESYTASVHALSLRVLALIIESLGHEADRIVHAFAAHTSFLRLNHYPPCPTPAAGDSASVPELGNLGIGHHTDAGALTILDQADIPGLQVLHADRWWNVPMVHGCMTVNIGDVVQVWSNDRYPAPVHRVLANSHQERHSTACFLNPPADFDYAPLLPPVEAHLAVYRPVNWGHFRSRRAAGDYADHGEEIQISHFRRTASAQP